MSAQLYRSETVTRLEISSPRLYFSSGSLAPVSAVLLPLYRHVKHRVWLTAARGHELWSAAYGIKAIKRAWKRQREVTQSFQLTTRDIPVPPYWGCLVASWNNTLSLFLQVRDCPQTSSGFTRFSKELRNKEEYSQVLFSGFCRKVRYKREKNTLKLKCLFCTRTSFFLFVASS